MSRGGAGVLLARAALRRDEDEVRAAEVTHDARDRADVGGDLRPDQHDAAAIHGFSVGQVCNLPSSRSDELACSVGQEEWQVTNLPHVKNRHAISFSTTLPSTSVSRKSRPR